jgi:hypothetical protein
MAKSSSSTRAPRGTKILAKAFFDAADEIPDSQRAEVVKAALALIRDELKAAREKVAAANAKAKKKAGKPSAGSVLKLPRRQGTNQEHEEGSDHSSQGATQARPEGGGQAGGTSHSGGIRHDSHSVG